MKRLTMLAVLASMGLSAAAQINSPQVPGYFARGEAMYDGKIYIGAIDQLGLVANSRELTPEEHRRLDRARAMAELARGRYDRAMALLEQWLDRYGAAPERTDVRMAVGDCLFTRGRYAEALKIYEELNPDALADPSLAPVLRYRLGYTCLKLGEPDRAAQAFTALRGDREFGDAADFYLGYILYAKGDYAAARKALLACNLNTEPGVMADYYLMQMDYREENYQQAFTRAKALLQRQGVPADFVTEANRVLGESLFVAGSGNSAIPYLRKYVAAVEQAKGTPAVSALYALGVSLYQQGDYSGAASALRPVTADDSAMGQNAYLYLGLALLHLDDTDGAIMAFDRALRLDHDPQARENAYYNYAVASTRGGTVPFGSSVRTFENFLADFPDSPHAAEVRDYVITGYVTDNNYEAALAAIGRVKNPDSRILAAKQRVLYTLGARSLTAGNADSAVKYLSQAYALRPHDAQIGAETEMALGEAYLRQGKYEKAIELLSRYLKGRRTDNFPVAEYDLGYAFMGIRNYAAAQSCFERLTASPGNLGGDILADAETRLGDCLYYQKEWTKATGAYERAYAMNPAVGDYPLFQQAVIRGYAGDFAAKLKGMRTLKARFPSSPLIADALLEMTEAQLRTGDKDAAMATWQELIDSYPATTQGRNAYLQMAATQADDGDVPAAIDTYKKLISAFPTSDEGIQGAEMLKNIMAGRGELDRYMAFINGIDNAPRFDATQADKLAFETAERQYLSDEGTALLKKYLDRYGVNGSGSLKTLTYLIEDAREHGKADDEYTYASQLVSRWPDNAAAEQAYAVMARYDQAHGNGEKALTDWQELEKRASTPALLDEARTGVMRVARELSRPAEMERAAEALLASSTAGPGVKTEAGFSLGLARQLKGDNAAAVRTWSPLAAQTDDVYGAMSAVYLAQALLDGGNAAEAAKVAGTFTDSGTPHGYWLARGFIVLADAYNSLGRKNEADDLLRAVRENYNGTEPDIFSMIDRRLPK